MPTPLCDATDTVQSCCNRHPITRTNGIFGPPKEENPESPVPNPLAEQVTKEINHALQTRGLPLMKVHEWEEGGGPMTSALTAVKNMDGFPRWSKYGRSEMLCELLQENYLQGHTELECGEGRQGRACMAPTGAWGHCGDSVGEPGKSASCVAIV